MTARDPINPSDSGRRHGVVVVGSSFAGLTAALEVKRRMKDRAEVTVLDRRDHCTFITSLIWLPFGKRSADEVTFKLAPVYERKGIRFAHTAAEGFDLERQVVVTADGGGVCEADALRSELEGDVVWASLATARATG